MLCNYKVGIYNRLPSTKVGGINIPGELSWVKDTEVDIQPYSAALLLKQYGYDIEVNKRIFMDFDADIKIGTVFYYTNSENIIEKYEAKIIINWDYLEVAVLRIS